MCPSYGLNLRMFLTFQSLQEKAHVHSSICTHVCKLIADWLLNSGGNVEYCMEERLLLHSLYMWLRAIVTGCSKVFWTFEPDWGFKSQSKQLTHKIEKGWGYYIMCHIYIYIFTIYTHTIYIFLAAISYCIWCDSVLDEAGELFLVGLLVVLHQVWHVVSHVHAHDVFAMRLRVELFALWVVTREPL